MQTQTKKWLTRQEAADQAEVHLRTIARWLEEGLLTRHRIRGGRGIRIDAAELARVNEPGTEG